MKRPFFPHISVAFGFLGALAGCATRAADDALPHWPPGAKTTRIEFLGAIRSATDLATVGWSNREATAPGAPAAATMPVIRRPTSVAISKDERFVYIVNGSSDIRLMEIDRRKARMAPLTNGTAPIPPNPFAVAVDSADRIYVTDMDLGEVWVFDRSQGLLRRFGAGYLARPTGIAIDDLRSRLYVSDHGGPHSDRHVVEVFSLTGERLRTLGRRGHRSGQLHFPVHLAVSRSGTIYVANTQNYRIEVFTPSGEPLPPLGSRGVGYEKFGRIKGMAFDELGNLHVVDGDFGIVQMFNALHEPLMHYGRSHSARLLTKPIGIAIDSHNQILITDFVASRLVLFALKNTTLADCLDLPGDTPKPHRGSAEPEPWGGSAVVVH